MTTVVQLDSAGNVREWGGAGGEVRHSVHPRGIQAKATCDEWDFLPSLMTEWEVQVHTRGGKPSPTLRLLALRLLVGGWGMRTGLLRLLLLR